MRQIVIPEKHRPPGRVPDHPRLRTNWQSPPRTGLSSPTERSSRRNDKLARRRRPAHDRGPRGRARDRRTAGAEAGGSARTTGRSRCISHAKEQSSVGFTFEGAPRQGDTSGFGDKLTGTNAGSDRGEVYVHRPGHGALHHSHQPHQGHDHRPRAALGQASREHSGGDHRRHLSLRRGAGHEALSPTVQQRRRASRTPWRDERRIEPPGARPPGAVARATTAAVVRRTASPGTDGENRRRRSASSASRRSGGKWSRSGANRVPRIPRVADSASGQTTSCSIGADLDRRKSGAFENAPYVAFGHLERLAVKRTREGRLDAGLGERFDVLAERLERSPATHTDRPSVPPGRSTRSISAAAAGRSVKNGMPCWQRTTSKLPSSSGSSVTDASRYSIGAASAGAGTVAACASIAPLTSLATTRPAVPARAAASRATTPVPLATSSTSWPGRTPPRQPGPRPRPEHHRRQVALVVLGHRGGSEGGGAAIGLGGVHRRRPAYTAVVMSPVRRGASP